MQWPGRCRCVLLPTAASTRALRCLAPIRQVPLGGPCRRPRRLGSPRVWSRSRPDCTPRPQGQTTGPISARRRRRAITAAIHPAWRSGEAGDCRSDQATSHHRNPASTQRGIVVLTTSAALEQRMYPGAPPSSTRSSACAKLSARYLPAARPTRVGRWESLQRRILLAEDIPSFAEHCPSFCAVKASMC
jgi:hypothetical protein